MGEEDKGVLKENEEIGEEISRTTNVMEEDRLSDVQPECDPMVIEAKNDLWKTPDASHFLGEGDAKPQEVPGIVHHREPLLDCTNSLDQRGELVEGLQSLGTEGKWKRRARMPRGNLQAIQLDEVQQGDANSMKRSRDPGKENFGMPLDKLSSKKGKITITSEVAQHSEVEETSRSGPNLINEDFVLEL